LINGYLDNKKKLLKTKYYT